MDKKRQPSNPLHEHGLLPQSTQTKSIYCSQMKSQPLGSWCLVLYHPLLKLKLSARMALQILSQLPTCHDNNIWVKRWRYIVIHQIFKILGIEFGVMARTESRNALLETTREYYENCPGCKIDRLNEEQRGVPYRYLSYIWIVSLCTGASIHAPSFISL